MINKEKNEYMDKGNIYYNIERNEMENKILNSNKNYIYIVFGNRKFEINKLKTFGIYQAKYSISYSLFSVKITNLTTNKKINGFINFRTSEEELYEIEVSLYMKETKDYIDKNKIDIKEYNFLVMYFTNTIQEILIKELNIKRKSKYLHGSKGMKKIF